MPVHRKSRGSKPKKHGAFVHVLQSAAQTPPLAAKATAVSGGTEMSFEDRVPARSAKSEYSKQLRGAYDSKFRITVDKRCLKTAGGEDIFLGSQVATTSATQKVFLRCQYSGWTCGKSLGLLSVEVLQTPKHMAEWKMRMQQYAALAREYPQNVLKITAAWTCDSAATDFTSAADKGSVAGFVLLEIPEGLEFWPLRQFVLSSKDLRGGWLASAANWLTNFTWEMATQRYEDSGMRELLRSLVIHDGYAIDPATYSADSFGVLVNPRAPASKKSSAPVVSLVMIPPLPMLKPYDDQKPASREQLMVHAFAGIFMQIGYSTNVMSGRILFTPEHALPKVLALVAMPYLSLQTLNWITAQYLPFIVNLSQQYASWISSIFWQFGGMAYGLVIMRLFSSAFDTVVGTHYAPSMAARALK